MTRELGTKTTHFVDHSQTLENNWLMGNKICPYNMTFLHLLSYDRSRNGIDVQNVTIFGFLNHQIWNINIDIIYILT